MMPRIVTLNDIAISPAGTGLVMDAVAKTFRYLDEAEIARNAPKPAAPAPAPAAPAKSGGHGGAG